MGKLVVIVGGQYGSEAKGHVVGHLAATEVVPLVVRVGGSQAGHTVVDPLTGQAWALRHVPVAAVTNPLSLLAIAEGSEIDMDVLRGEIDALDAAGYRVSERLAVDPQATVIDSVHRQHEQHLSLDTRIGSTCKGVGAARAARAVRAARLVGDNAKDWPWLPAVEPVADRAMTMLANGGTVIVEAAQGYGLGLHAGYYPQCTSSDCRAIDALAMAGVSPWNPVVSTFEPWVVLRTFPIRVAGDSGPMSLETDWPTLAALYGDHIQPERTTVTKRVRRVGGWDQRLARAAIRANGGKSVRVALMFLDYLFPHLAGSTSKEALQDPDVVTYLEGIESGLGLRLELLGTGPSSIIDRR